MVWACEATVRSGVDAALREELESDSFDSSLDYFLPPHTQPKNIFDLTGRVLYYRTFNM